MKNECRFPPVLSKKGLFPFLIVFAVLFILITWNFILIGYNDLFNKGLDFVVIIDFVVSEVASLLPEILTFSLMISAAILYKRLFNENTDLLKCFRQDLIVVVLFSFFIWVFAAFIEPKIDWHAKSIYISIKRMPRGEKFKMVDMSKYKYNYMSEDLVGIITISDSLNNEIEKSKEYLRKFLKTHASPEVIDSLFVNTNDLSNLGFTREEIKNYKAQWNGQEYPAIFLRGKIMNTKSDVKYFKNQLKKGNKLIWQMFFTPIPLLLLFIMSVQLGIINYKTNHIVLIVFLYFFIVTAWSYLSSYINKLINKETISVVQGNLSLLLILLLVNLGLNIMVRKKIAKAYNLAKSHHPKT